MKSNGRPPKYSDDELLEALKQYQIKYPNKKLSYGSLEKETGIAKHIWMYRMKDIIESRNKKISGGLVPKVEGYDLPSVEDILKRCNGDMQQISYYLETLIDMVNTFYAYKDSKNTIDELKYGYENKIKELELRVKEFQKIIDNQQNVINKYIIDSASKEKRMQESIKDNIIQFSPKNLDNYDKMFEELLK